MTFKILKFSKKSFCSFQKMNSTHCICYFLRSNVWPALRQSANIGSCLVCSACARTGTSLLRVDSAFSVFTFTNGILIMHLYRISFVILHINFLENFKSWAVSRGRGDSPLPPLSEIRGGGFLQSHYQSFDPEQVINDHRQASDRLVNLERIAMHPKRLASISDNSVMPLFQAAPHKKLSKIEKRDDVFYFFFSNFDKNSFIYFQPSYTFSSKNKALKLLSMI